jgi:hypothetical protein
MDAFMDFQKYFDEIVHKINATPSLKLTTSTKFRQRLFELVCDTSIPGPVIELGCYTGGTSVFLAKACLLTGREFFIVDVSDDFLQTTRDNIERIVGHAPVNTFAGNSTEFAKSGLVTTAPYLVFIDADHTYPAVLQDIHALASLPMQPTYWAFHDYSLRGTKGNRVEIAVDRAIHDAFGTISPMERIGTQTIDASAPNAGGDFMTANGSEGVLFKAINTQRTLNPSCLANIGQAVFDLHNREAYFTHDHAHIDRELAALYGTPRAEPAIMQAFLARWYPQSLPSMRRLRSILASDGLRTAYFEDFRALIDSVHEPHKQEIYSTKAQFSSMSVLNDPLLNALGLLAFRAAFIRGRIEAKRKSAVAKLMHAGSFAPQSVEETEQFFERFEFFEESGFVALPLKPKTSYETLVQELADEIVMKPEWLTKVDGDTLLYRMPLSSTATPEAMSIVNHRAFLPLYSMICGHGIQPIPAFSEFVHQGGGDQTQVDANKIWHIDTFHNTYKWWYFFSGVTREIGPFMYYKGSNKLNDKKLLWLSIYGLYTALTVKNGDVVISPRITQEDIAFFDLGEPQAFDVAPMTLVIADTFGVHRRSEPQSAGKVRRSFFGWARAELI